MSTDPTHLNTLTLHGLRYGELDADKDAAARAHLASCDLCRERLAAQHAERAAFEAMPIPAAIRDAAAAPPPAANDNRAWLRTMSLIAAVAAILLVVIVQPWQVESTVDDGIRSKGHDDAIVLQAMLNSASGPVAIADGAQVHPGDRVQLQVRRAPAAWVTIAGVDGTGQASVYGSWQPATDDWEPAPFGLTLDGTLGEERLYAIFTDGEPNRAALRAALAAGSPPTGAIWEVITLDKRP